MLEVLTRICSGKGRDGDIELLEELGAMLQKFSLCGLGTSAPNPVLTNILYFRDEYEAHLEGRCPAGKCKELITFSINDDCIGCTRCAQRCPADAIERVADGQRWTSAFRRLPVTERLCGRPLRLLLLALAEIVVDVMGKAAQLLDQGITLLRRHAALATHHVTHDRRQILHHHDLVGLGGLALYGLLDVLKQL